MLLITNTVFIHSNHKYLKTICTLSPQIDRMWVILHAKLINSETMTKAEILALLVAKFASVRKDGLEQMALSLVPLCPSKEKAEEIVGALTADQVGEFVKEWRKSADAENQKAIETFKKSLPQPQPEPKQDPKPDPKPNPQPESPAPQAMTPEAIAKIVSEAVAAQVKPLQEEVTRMKGKEVLSSRQSLLESELKGTPESYRSVVMEGFNSRQFDTDDAFNEYLNSIKEQIKNFKQEMADNGLKNFGGVPTNPKADPDKVDPEVTAFIEAKKSDGGLGGKKL